MGYDLFFSFIPQNISHRAASSSWQKQSMFKNPLYFLLAGTLMEGCSTALFYRLNTLIRLVTDQLLGYRLCHLSKSWESGKKFFVVLVVKSKHDNSMVITRGKRGEGGRRG